jgi:SAM-dependent methyltransferase
LAELGAHVTGLDYSQRFIERAKQRTGGNDAIRYEVLDATDEDALRSLGENQFDAAVCTMALMDIVTIDPIMRSLAYLLKPGARFVYSILHPCFHSAEMVKFAEMAEVDGRIMVKTGVKVTRYLTPFVVQTYGIVGQPEAQYLFHRPLSQLFQASFAAGFIIDGCEEPRLTAVAEKAPGLRWRDLPEIPPVLVVRLRKPN